MSIRSGCELRLRYDEAMDDEAMTDDGKRPGEGAEQGRPAGSSLGEIRVIGDPVLHERAAEVTSFDGSLRELVRRMTRIMHGAPGVGLAATQVGVLKRVLVYDVEDDVRILVNPVLGELADETEESEEACLSVPGIGVPVTRPVRVRVCAVDVDGEAVDFVAEGFEARVIQHEHDHLEGILIVDRTSRRARAAALRALAERQAAGEREVVGGL
jgi:peptide deformylase